MAEYPDHLSEGIAELSRLLVNEEALDDTLRRVAELACRTLGGADVAGVTLLRDGKPTTAVFTDPASPEIDSAPYETGIGPCLDAFRHQQVFRIDSTVADEQWPPFSEAAAERKQHDVDGAAERWGARRRPTDPETYRPYSSAASGEP